MLTYLLQHTQHPGPGFVYHKLEGVAYDGMVAKNNNNNHNHHHPHCIVFVPAASSLGPSNTVDSSPAQDRP
ncbi:hypothetical protein B0H16DRAFT_1749633 [Mycena metata]|uniref:Uncharacterized protein n=1 Tax=Mycena metata TaxID=1033252 RepID=A0AAD7GMX8_9AGAR|nr:hypothetical protein B0H16DRAFT_1749633 [Mycena metata]